MSGGRTTFSTGPLETIRRALLAGLLPVCLILGLAVPPAGAATSPRSEVRSVYRAVLSAEYFGPASGVCARLSASGRAAFTAGGGGTCAKAFATQQHVLRHKVPGVDDSGYTPTQWRQVVDDVMSALEVTVDGSKASAIGPSGIPGRTRLVRVAGRWLFTTYPPSVES